MTKIHVSPDAVRDLQEIKEYITTDLSNPSAALRTASAISKAIRRLITFPDMGAPLSSVLSLQKDYRFLVCGSYLVFYRHDRDAVYILGVLYGRRDYAKILFERTLKKGETSEGDLL